MSKVTPEVEAMFAHFAESSRKMRAIPAATLRAMAENPETRLQMEASARDFARMAKLYATGARESRLAAELFNKHLRRTRARFQA